MEDDLEAGPGDNTAGVSPTDGATAAAAAVKPKPSKKPAQKAGAPPRKKGPPRPKGLLCTFTFYARLVEFIVCFLLIDQTPLYGDKCFFTAWSIYGCVFHLFWHLAFFVFPCQGRLSFLKRYRVREPKACLLQVCGSFGSVLSVYYFVSWGGCPKLIELVWVGLFGCGILYTLGAAAGEKGGCELWRGCAWICGAAPSQAEAKRRYLEATGVSLLKCTLFMP